MPNNRGANVRKRSDPDPRVERSTRALGRALISLLAEREFDAITVQQVLDRAGVGRATFYSHFRNKVDVLHSSYEGALEFFEERLRASPGDERLFPVAEFLEHVRDESATLDALRRSGQFTVMRGLFVTHTTRVIEQRARTPADPAQRRLLAQMLAGALAEAVDWWDAHREKTSPRQVDLAFHALAGKVLG